MFGGGAQRCMAGKSGVSSLKSCDCSGASGQTTVFEGPVYSDDNVSVSFRCVHNASLSGSWKLDAALVVDAVVHPKVVMTAASTDSFNSFSFNFTADFFRRYTGKKVKKKIGTRAVDLYCCCIALVRTHNSICGICHSTLRDCSAVSTKCIQLSGLHCWGPVAWNSLPDNLCDPSLCSNSFRRSLKLHFVRDKK